MPSTRRDKTGTDTLAKDKREEEREPHQGRKEHDCPSAGLEFTYSHQCNCPQHYKWEKEHGRPTEASVHKIIGYDSATATRSIGSHCLITRHDRLHCCLVSPSYREKRDERTQQKNGKSHKKHSQDKLRLWVTEKVPDDSTVPFHLGKETRLPTLAILIFCHIVSKYRQNINIKTRYNTSAGQFGQEARIIREFTNAKI